MFYPNHQIRNYCKYLGSLMLDNRKLDLGVYEASDGLVSHATVYGDNDWEYYSGDIVFTDKLRSYQSLHYKINKIIYMESLKGESK